MDREVRRVPPDWDHEKYSDKPLGDREYWVNATRTGIY
jgi:hypothetical protein